MVAPTAAAPMSHACWTLPNITWSNLLGSVSSSLWLSLTRKGIRWAYLRPTMPSTPNVEATALQPPSMASSTMFSGSKYAGFGREAGAGRVLDALVDGQDRHVPGAGKPAVVDQQLVVAQHLRVAVGVRQHAIDEVRAGQVQHPRVDDGLVLQQVGSVVAERARDRVDEAHAARLPSGRPEQWRDPAWL